MSLHVRTRSVPATARPIWTMQMQLLFQYHVLDMHQGYCLHFQLPLLASFHSNGVELSLPQLDKLTFKMLWSHKLDGCSSL